MKALKAICSSIVILFNMSLAAHAMQGDNMYNAIDIGTISSCSGITYGDVQYTGDFNDDFGTGSRDIFYKFTLVQPTTLRISLCDSDIDTYLSVIDGSGYLIEDNDDNGPTCSGSAASMEITLNAGTYYIVTEGVSYYIDGNVSVYIEASGSGVPSVGTNMNNAINAGVLGSQGFVDIRDNSCYGNDYGQIGDDIFYKFTLNSPAQVAISHCGSGFQTYGYLLDAYGNLIASNNGNGPLCSGSEASLIASLSSGTYYVVSEGYSDYTGVINTSISINRGDEDLNYVTNKSYDDDGNVIAETRSYYDNAGTPLQTQAKNIVAGQVIASQPVYDALSRPVISTLAAPINSSSFSYKEKFMTNSNGEKYNFYNFDLSATDNPNPLYSADPGTLGWYYSNNNNQESYVPSTGFPYSRTVYHDDRSGAIKKVGAPGEALRPGSGHEVQAFVMPVVNELSHYLQVRNKFFTQAQIGALPASLATQSTQSVTKDENGKEQISIQDRSGKSLMTARPGNELVVSNTFSVGGTYESSVLYIRLFQPSTLSITGNYSAPLNMDTGVPLNGSGPYSASPGYYKLSLSEAQVTYTNGYQDVSYNFYNQVGQLVASIAPEGVKKLIDNVNAYSALAEVPFVSTYEYDTQGHLIAETSTNTGRTEYIYRADGSIRFSQNAVQRKSGSFSYTNYDKTVRPFESGEYVPGDISFTSAKTNTALRESVAPDGGLTGGVKRQWVRTYYDYANNAHGLSGYNQDEFLLNGAVSWTENEQAKTWYSYDSEGRVNWIVKQINGLGTKTINYTYNAQGSVSRVDYQKDAAAERFIHDYEYDANGRLSAVYTTTDPNVTRKLQAKYYYYLHGPLKRVEI
uniref:DUF6443 domain-containing protein n=1 Tax=Arcticibacter sp. TaxID=1872630 RepID=UPI00388EAFC8